MKNLFRIFLFVAMLFGGLSARAQFETHFTSRFTKYMQYGGIEVVCRVRNISGQVVRFGGENADVGFALKLKDPRSNYLTPQKEFSPEPFVLGNGESHEFKVPLSRVFKIRTTGRYVLQAVFDNATHNFPSRKFFIDVSEGGVLRTSVSTLTGRTYILKSMLRDEGEFLFLQVEDPRGEMVYGVYELGRYLKFNPPQLLFDAEGGYHVLHTYQPKFFAHSRFDSKGAPLGQDYYKEGYSQVLLRMNENGEIFVSGGIPHER